MPANGIKWTKRDKRVLERLIRETPEKKRDLLRTAAAQLTSDIQLSFGTSPSAPGDPPGVDTGTLRASMGWELQDEDTAVIHDGVEYGYTLEMGLEHIAARPFMSPMFEAWRQREFMALVRTMGLLS